jgi:hypothetical protein
MVPGLRSTIRACAARSRIRSGTTRAGARQGAAYRGWSSNGFQTTLLATSQHGMHKDTAEVVQQHLTATGIRSELQLPDWSTRGSRGLRGQ